MKNRIKQVAFAFLLAVSMAAMALDYKYSYLSHLGRFVMGVLRTAFILSLLRACEIEQPILKEVLLLVGAVVFTMAVAVFCFVYIL